MKGSLNKPRAGGEINIQIDFEKAELVFTGRVLLTTRSSYGLL
jgi:hypothetical protein